MILILSTSFDDDTNVVMEHLENIGESYIRLNDIDLFNGKNEIYYSTNSPDQLIIENEYFGKINFSEINVVWYRKWGNFEKYKNILGEDLSFEMLQYLHSEYSGVLNLILFSLRNKKWINSYKSVSKLSKIEMLIKAKESGFLIPHTVITNQFTSLDKSLITKSINDGREINYNNKKFPLMTVEYKYPQNFTFPSLFQEKITKEYELRIFHIKGKNYPMAIFSQNDERTTVDFRNYNKEMPNRFVPYRIPKNLNSMINKLMKSLSLDTGSIDIIKGIEGNYYFLEINPSGQFRMTSYRCNYNLHFEMAQQLKKLNNEKKTS